MSNKNDDQFPFNDLFGSVEQIFREFDRMFFDFSFPNIDSSSSSSSKSLRDEVLKEEIDENLDGKLDKFDFGRTFLDPHHQRFSSSSIKTHLERHLTPSGKCFIEREIEEISTNENEKTIKETTRKVCGENHHTTIKINGQIQREFGNATIEELDQIDSSKFTKTYSDLFKKLFS